MCDLDCRPRETLGGDVDGAGLSTGNALTGSEDAELHDTGENGTATSSVFAEHSCEGCGAAAAKAATFASCIMATDPVPAGATGGIPETPTEEHTVSVLEH